MHCYLIGKQCKPSAKFVGMDSMSLIHFEVHYNYVGGPPPCTLEEHRPVDTDGLARCWILPLSRLSPSETEAYQTEEWLQCESSSLRAVLGEFMWIPSADTWFFREMHCGCWMGSRDALKQSTLFFVSLCFTVLGSISINLYFWWSDQEKSSWRISIRSLMDHLYGCPVKVHTSTANKRMAQPTPLVTWPSISLPAASASCGGC